jgi:hypothetical protein
MKKYLFHVELNLYLDEKKLDLKKVYRFSFL